MTDLKPCPFCGKSVAAVVTVAEADNDFENKWSMTHFVTVCDFKKGGCGACGECDNDTPEKAAEAWNRRVDIKGCHGCKEAQWDADGCTCGINELPVGNAAKGCTYHVYNEEPETASEDYERGFKDGCKYVHIDRAAIMRMCNDIEDIVCEIYNTGHTMQNCDYDAIFKRLKEIRKDLQ